MAKSKRESKDSRLSPGGLLPIRLFIGIAFLVGCYLLAVSLQGMNAVGCGPDSGCEKVLHSRWAYWFGLPVSAFALAVYAAIFAATFRLSPKTPPASQIKAWLLLIPSAVTVIGAALWFIILQFFVIKAICPFCMAAHGCGFIAALLTLRAAPIGTAVAPALARKLVGLALAGVTLLVAGQILHQKKTFEVTSIPLPTNAAPTTPANTTNPPASTPIPPNPYAGMFWVVYNTNVLDLRQTPLIGSSNAPYVIVSLYDYACSSCRLMHKPLMEMFNAFSNELVIVSLPMPLDPQCNPSVKSIKGWHTNSCAYARLALTLWRADRAKLPQFDNFMFTGSYPPPLEAAETLAANLLGGPDALARAKQDPWVEKQLQQNIGIYETAFHQGHGNMPQLIIGRQAVTGLMDQANLRKIIEKEFGLGTTNRN